MSDTGGTFSLFNIIFFIYIFFNLKQFTRDQTNFVVMFCYCQCNFLSMVNATKLYNRCSILTRELATIYSYENYVIELYLLTEKQSWLTEYNYKVYIVVQLRHSNRE